MHISIKRISLNELLITVLLLVTPLTVVLSYYDYYQMVLISFLLFYTVISLLMNRVYLSKTILLSFLFYLIWIALIFIIKPIHFQSIIRVFQVIGCVVFFMHGATFKYNITDFRICKNLVSLVVVLIFIHWIIVGVPIRHYAWIFDNSNSFGAYLLILLLIRLTTDLNKIDYVIVLAILLFLLISDSRSSLLASILLLFLVSVANKTIMQKQWVFLLFFELLFIALFVIGYSYFQNTHLFNVVNDYSIHYFQKPLDSGRNRIWPILLDLIKKHPLTGYGLSAVPRNFTGISLSAHNLYLQTALQVGLIGLVLLVIIIVSIFIYSLSSINIAPIPLFTFAILLHECFEITLTQNLFSFGIVVWFVWGISCNYNLIKGVEKSNELSIKKTD